MNAASQQRLTPILAGLALLLGALCLLLLFGLGRGVHWGAPRAAAPLPASGKPAKLPPPQPLVAFAPVWQQSLFSPNRKPEAHAANGGSSLGELELTGIILTPQLRLALLRERKGGGELRLREGQRTADGSLSVVEVKPRSVILDTRQGRTELKLPAGAPIDITPAKAEPPPAAGANEVRRMQPPEAAGAAPATPPAYSPEQVERLRKLKATILERRAASQAATHEGAH